MKKRWITVSEAAKYLSLHPVTVRRKIDKEEIPAAKLGHSIRVDLTALGKQMERKQK